MNFLIKITLSLVIIYISSCTQPESNTVTVQKVPTKKAIDLSSCEYSAIAHRGYSEIYPENTLLSIEEAFKRGIKICEVDITTTFDDVYVLFHDKENITRTTNEYGKITELTYNEIKNLDAGKWKGSQFSENKIPTLVEALQLAERYDAYLYLDIKDLNISLLKKTIDSAGVGVERCLPSVTRIKQAEILAEKIPGIKWVWFGRDVEDPKNIAWFKERINLGCEVFEINSTKAYENSDWLKGYKTQIHNLNKKLWAFTENSNHLLEQIISYGVDGIETDRPTALKTITCSIENNTIFPKKLTTGNWTFQNKDNSSLGIGSRFMLVHKDENNKQFVKYGTTKDFNIKPINGEIADIMYVPKLDTSNGLFFFNNFLPQNKGSLQYNYTLLMDVYLPKRSLRGFVGLIQTNIKNFNDADIFINSSNGIGVSDNYHGRVYKDTWHRIALSFYEDKIKILIDGNLVGKIKITNSDSRWALFNNSPAHGMGGLYLFSDNDNETAELFVNNVQIRNYSMSDDEIGIYGKATSQSIPINNTGIYFYNIEGEISSFTDWDNNKIYTKLDSTTDINSLKANYKLPYGATCSIDSLSTLDFSKGSILVTVTAEDGRTREKWELHVEK